MNSVRLCAGTPCCCVKGCYGVAWRIRRACGYSYSVVQADVVPDGAVLNVGRTGWMVLCGVCVRRPAVFADVLAFWDGWASSRAIEKCSVVCAGRCAVALCGEVGVLGIEDSFIRSERRVVLYAGRGENVRVWRSYTCVLEFG